MLDIKNLKASVEGKEILSWIPLKLGFQGNVHEIPEEDYETLLKALKGKK